MTTEDQYDKEYQQAASNGYLYRHPWRFVQNKNGRILNFIKHINLHTGSKIIWDAK